MQQQVAKSTKTIIFTAHTLAVLNEQEMVMEVRIPVKGALKNAGIEYARFHDLRHSTASNLAKSGASLLEIADVLGHSNTTITKRYAHLCISHKRDLINRVMGKLG